MLQSLMGIRDYAGIELMLSEHPALANEGIPFDEVNTTKAHPLHRICDGVYAGKFSDEEGVRIAKIFLFHGAKVNGDGLIPKRDTPLIAAASLFADGLAILYIENGADILHAGTHGGTALHWAAWCGRNRVVQRLIQEGAAVNQQCIDFKSTPLYWAVHGIKKNDADHLQGSLECIKMLLQAGADKNIPNVDGKTIYGLLDEKDVELRMVLESI